MNGLEIEAVWTPLPGLSLNLNGTVQDPKFVNGLHFKGFDANGNVIQIAVDGLLPTRIPKKYGNFTASYALPPTEWGRLTVNGSWQYTGRRALKAKRPRAGK